MTDIPIDYDHLLDITTLHCPLPLLETKKKLSELSTKEVLLVITSDPSFEVDMRVFIRQTDNKLLKSWREGTKNYFLVERG